MRIAIVGGGASGLSAALFALDRGADVTLYEASDRLGGCMATRRDDDFVMERGPDSFVRTKPASIKLCERLGIDLIGTRDIPDAGARIVRDGRLHPLPQGLQLLAPTRMAPFAASPVMSWAGKLRMGMDLVLPRRKGASDVDDESLASFVRRRLGGEALDRLAQPLVAGIYSGDPERLSLRATMPRLLDLEREHRSLILGMRKSRPPKAATGARYSLFLSPESGMETVSGALTESVELGGARLRRGSAIDSLEALQEGGAAPDGVVLAVSAARAAALLDGEVARELEAIRTTSSATINFVWPTDAVPGLSGYGFVVPVIEGRFVMACTNSSNKYAGRAPEGSVLLRAFVGGALGPDVPSLSDSELIEGARADLSELLGIRAQPERTLLTRHTGAQPQYELGHLDRVSRIEQLMADRPGVELAGNSYRGVGVADCIESARRAIESLIPGG